jgi:hypothetical protein
MAWITFQPKDNFNCTIYTGNNSTNAQTGVGFQPDLIWFKRRDSGAQHSLFDAVRGVTKGLASDTNATTGVGIYKYTGTGSNATIAHGLGVAPKLVIVKRTDNTSQWSVYHYEVGEAKHLALDTKIAEVTSSNYWNDTAPTNSVFSLGSGTDVNASGGTYIAYVYAEKRGFSRIGKYIGNNDTDGAFVFTGFKPGFLITKSISSGDTQWMMRDKKRGFNGAIKTLYADSSEQETSADSVELLSNGFVFRDTSSAQNAAAGYAFWAFAEEPLVASNKDVVTAG